MSDLDIWGNPKKHEPDIDDEGEEVDPDAPSSETNSGIERDWAAGYGRGQ